MGLRASAKASASATGPALPSGAGLKSASAGTLPVAQAHGLRSAAKPKPTLQVLRRGIPFQVVEASMHAADIGGKHGEAKDYAWMKEGRASGQGAFAEVQVPIAWLNDEYRPDDPDYLAPSDAAEARIKDYAERDTDPPPILVTYSGWKGAKNLGFVANGNHRVAALRLQGRETVRAFVPEVDLEIFRQARGEAPALAREAIRDGIAIAVGSSALTGLRNQIRVREDQSDWGWHHGGCHTFAPALQRALGVGEVVGVCQQDADFLAEDGAPLCWINLHSMVRVDGGLFDSRGEQPEHLAKDAFKMSGADWEAMPLVVASLEELKEGLSARREEYFWPEDAYISETEELEKILRDSLKLATGLHALRKDFEAKGVDSYVMPHGDRLVLSKVVVPKGDRGGGLGTEFMNRLVALADEAGKTLSLTPDTSFGATSVARLTKFYARFGFLKNKGRAKDYRISEAMLRHPVERLPVPGPTGKVGGR